MNVVKKYQPTLSLMLKPSNGLNKFFIFIHLLALIASIGNALPLTVKLVIFSGVALNLYWTQHRKQPPLSSIHYSHELGWQINRLGDAQHVQILPSTVITTFIIFLHFTENNKQSSLLIASDALSADDYRRLVVELKISANNKRL